MVDLFRAEWHKIAGNRWAAGCLIWVFPLGAAVFIVLAALILMLSNTARTNLQGDKALLWTEFAISAWDVPSNPFGRLLLLGFTAVIFGGEYQWRTWKNIIPRNYRPRLILIKFVTLGAFVVSAFGLMSIIWSVGWGILAQIGGVSYGPAITGKVLSEFAQDYVLQASLTFTATVIAAGYAALAALFTRSILGGVLVGFGITVLESLFSVILIFVGWLFGFPRIVFLARYLPAYNLTNVSSWIRDNVPLNSPIEVPDHATYVFSDSLGFSLVVLAGWMLGLFMLTTYLFQKQDITS